MKKTRKITLFVLLLSLICLLTVCLCACTDGSNGTDGKDGANGKSAYEIWLEEGHSGTQADFLDWLKGTNGENGSGTNGEDGKDGKDGKSAYQIWLDNGHTGTETDFLTWLKGKDGIDGTDGQNGQDGEKGLSAYEIFLKYNTDYTGTEAQWIDGLVNNKLIRHTITFKSEVHEDIIKTAFDGLPLLDIPEVPEKEGQASSTWDITNFDTINKNMTVNAVYTMQKFTVTFHNEFTDDEDIVFENVTYGEAITEVPEVAAKIGNSGVWSVTDFSRITEDMQVNAIYETTGLQYVLINQQTQYRVSKGEMDINTQELFIPAYHDGKPVTVIDTEAFYVKDEDDCLQFKIAHIPNTVTEIRDRAFKYSNIENIILSDNVKNIGKGLFEGCANLYSATLGKGITKLPSDFGDYYGVFSNCSKLETVTLLAVTIIGECAFEGCSNLKNVNMPNNVNTIGRYAFKGCISLSNFIIPSSLEIIEYGLFENCTGLTNITLSSSVTYIQYGAFSGCSNLTSIDIPDSVQTIDGTAFENCSNLTTITINPYKGEEYNWNTNTTEMRVKLFIADNVFKNCIKLETIYFNGTQAEFAQLNIGSSGNTSFTDATIYFYSETQPTDDGYYWHYDLDGTTPVVWVKAN